MSEVLIGRVIAADIEPEDCMDCPKNVVQPVIDYVAEHTNDGSISPA